MTPRGVSLHRFAQVRVLAFWSSVLLLPLLAASFVLDSPYVSDFATGVGEGLLPAKPSSHHWLGTDVLYRDVLSRLVHGTANSLGIALLGTLVATAIGAVVGLLAASCAGSRLRFVDAFLMRVIDAGLSFPFLLLVMAIGSVLPQDSPTAVAGLLGTLGWLGMARWVRANALLLKTSGFVVAARGLGGDAWWVGIRHLFPHSLGVLFVMSTSALSGMILAESALGFLGVGLLPPTASLGSMLWEGQTFLTTDPRLALLPALLIAVSVLAANLLGERLRDATESKSFH